LHVTWGWGEKKKANNFENSLKKLNFSRLWLNTSENDSGYYDLPPPSSTTYRSCIGTHKKSDENDKVI
jgi:hypothetical protein